MLGLFNYIIFTQKYHKMDSMILQGISTTKSENARLT